MILKIFKTASLLGFLFLFSADSKAFLSDPARALNAAAWEPSAFDSVNIDPMASWEMPVEASLPITSCYGPRRLLHRYKEFHKGIDFGAPLQTEVLAVADGRVVWKGTSGCAGRTIILEHALTNGKTVLSIYRHLRNYRVKVGQIVGQGEIIALSGQSGKKLLRTQTPESRGCISGPHLHVEFKIVDENISPNILEQLIRKNHGHLSAFFREANPARFIPQLKNRCGSKTSA